MVRHELADRRLAAGLSQERLAFRLRVDRTTVGRWEQGTSTPQPWNRRPLAEALGITLDELDGLLAGGWRSRDRWQDGEMDRRSFLAGLGSLAATLLHLEEAVAAAGSDGQRVPALRLLGGAHQAAGESAFDRLDLTAATEHFHQAYEIGVELGDADMVAAAMIQLGDVARRRRRYGAALQLLDRAERPASAASLLTQVRRLQTLARTHAEVGDRSPFDAAIGRADDLAAQIPAEHHRLPDHSPRGLRLERGQGLTLLGQAASALAIYDDVALDQLVDERERGSFRIVQAQALAHAGELDEGVRVAVEGLGLARGYGSPRHVSRVQRMYDRLARRWTPAEPALADLRDALAA